MAVNEVELQVSAGASIAAVVPTLGASPLLVPCLEALRREGKEDLAVVLVHQGEAELELPPGLVDRLIRLPENLGFAAATNAGLAACGGEWVAVVNDDLVVAEGWLPPLVACLEEDPRAAAAQGWNLRADDPSAIDGGGIAWNRAWQAVQIGCGRSFPAAEAAEAAEAAGGPGEPVEVFGASATAALYRRCALEAVTEEPRPAAGEAPPVPAVFDPSLVSYYEDVDLAVRLRAAGWRSWRVPAARARHAGSLTGRRLGARRVALLFGNRYLVLARLLGSRFLRCLPRALARDLGDLAAALLRGQGRELAGIPAGWLRAALLLPRFAHRGKPALPLDEIRRFREEG